jgi:hypothetical protein
MLFVEGDCRNLGLPVHVLYNYAPGLAAHLTVLDIFLTIAAAGIDTNFVRLAAVRANHFACRVSSAVAEREIAIKLGFFVGIWFVGIVIKD